MVERIKEIIKDTYSKGFFHLFSANSLIQVIEFGSQFFVAWILLADDIGRIKSFQSFSSIAVIIAGIGFNSSILKLCSEKETPLIEKQVLFSAGIKATLLFSFLTLITILGLSKFNFISNDSITNRLFIYYSLSVPLVALNNLLIAYYQALKAFKKVSVLLVIARLIHVTLIIGLTYLFKLKGFVVGVVLGFLISSIILILKTDFLVGWKKTRKEHYLKNWNLAKYAFLAQAVNMTTLYLDVFILNHLIEDTQEFGYYGFALTLIAGLRVIVSTIQQFVIPFFSEFSSNQEQSVKAFKRANNLFTLIVLGTAVVSFFLIPLLIPFLYSGKYDDSMKYFQFLIISWVIRSLPGLKSPFMFANGYVKIIFYNMLLVLFISALPYWYLIKTYKINGALYGQLFTAIVFFIVVNISYKRVLNKIKKN